MVLLPMLMTVLLLEEEEDEDDELGLVVEVLVEEVEEEGSLGLVRVRSPRRWTSGMRTVRPARVMLGVPDIKARRDTLLPESYRPIMSVQCDQKGCAKMGIG